MSFDKVNYVSGTTVIPAKNMNDIQDAIIENIGDIAENTSDITALESAMSTKASTTDLANKVDKVTGKGLSTNDFTSALKSKLDGIESGATKNYISDSVPLMDGVGDRGVSTSLSRGDHRHPTDTSRASQADLTTTQQNLTTLTTRVTTAESDIDTLQVDMNTAKGNITNLQTGLSTADGNITTLQGNLTEAESEISTLQTDLDSAETNIVNLQEDKADKVGTYKDLTAGTAMQLLSDSTIEDSVPYLFRKTISDKISREEDEIVGGSIVWNQLVQNGNFADTNGWTLNNADSFTVSSNIASFVATAQNGRIQTRFAFLNNHKYLATATIKISSGQARFYADGGNSKTTTTNNAFETINIIFSATATTQTSFPRITDTRIENWDAVFVKNVAYFDLTAMFGSTIADYIYNLEQTTAGAGVAWFKNYFPKDYYEYNEGEIKSVEGLQSHDTVGFNQWDEEWELGTYNTSTGNPIESNIQIRGKNKIPILQNTTYYFSRPSNKGAIFILYYDKDDKFINSFSVASTSSGASSMSPVNAYFIRFGMGSGYGATYNHDICINISDPSKNGTYEPYEKHSYPLDSTKEFRGIPKLVNGELAYDGDIYPPSGKVQRRYGIVDLGTLDWRDQYSANGEFVAVFVPMKNRSVNAKATATWGFVGTWSAWSNGGDDLAYKDPNGNLYVRDSSYANYTVAQFKTAMSGVYLIYELETPTTETAEPYTDIQTVLPYGTEEYVTTSIVPVGHNTKYHLDTVKKLDNLPWDLSMIAPIENGTTASQAYSAGQYFLHNNLFCKAKTSIASGTTFTLNTNYEVTTIATELYSALNS